MQLTPADLCHPKLRATPFSSNWLFELKRHGFRAFVRTSPVEILSRNNRPLTQQFPEIVATLRRPTIDAVVDAGRTGDR